MPLSESPCKAYVGFIPYRQLAAFQKSKLQLKKMREWSLMGQKAKKTNLRQKAPIGLPVNKHPLLHSDLGFRHDAQFG